MKINEKICRRLSKNPANIQKVKEETNIFYIKQIHTQTHNLMMTKDE